MENKKQPRRRGPKKKTEDDKKISIPCWIKGKHKEAAMSEVRKIEEKFAKM